MIHDLDPIAGKNMRDLIYLARCHKEDRRIRLWVADICAHFMFDVEKGHYRPATLAALTALRLLARSELSKEGMLDAAGAANNDAYFVMPGSARQPAPRGTFVVLGVAYMEAAHGDKSIKIASAVETADIILGHIPLEPEQVAERQWQFDRLVARLSDPEPEDWPAPSR